MALQINRAERHQAFLSLWDKQSMLLQTGWIMDGEPLALAGTWEGKWGAEPGVEHRQRGCRVHSPMLGCFRRRQIRASRSSFW